MVRLRRAVPDFAGEVYAKLEYMNPMGSVKDRIARHMVEQAIADGRLQRGGTVIEASSGNTAMGLAMMAIEHDLRCVMVVRKQTSPEKIDALRAKRMFILPRRSVRLRSPSWALQASGAGVSGDRAAWHRGCYSV